LQAFVQNAAEALAGLQSLEADSNPSDALLGSYWSKLLLIPQGNQHELGLVSDPNDGDMDIGQIAASHSSREDLQSAPPSFPVPSITEAVATLRSVAASNARTIASSSQPAGFAQGSILPLGGARSSLQLSNPGSSFSIALGILQMIDPIQVWAQAVRAIAQEKSCSSLQQHPEDPSAPSRTPSSPSPRHQEGGKVEPTALQNS